MVVDFTLCITFWDFYNPHSEFVSTMTLYSNLVWSDLNLGFLHNLSY